MSAGEDAKEKPGGGLYALGVHRPVAMGMVVAAAVVFGFVALGKLKVDLLPPLQYPSLTVRTVYAGAAPEDVEERVTERLEDVLSTVGGLVRIASSSRAEVSEVLMEFEWGSNLPFLVQDVRERLDRVFLPPGVDKPLILRYDPGLDPVLRLALSGGNDLVRLRDLAEYEIERRLEGLPGVAAVRVKGGLVDEVQVLVDPQRLAAFNLTAETIRQRLQEENLNVPGGTLEEGSFEYVVRTLNEFKTLGEIEELPVATRDGRILKLRDLAIVRRSHRDRDLMLRVGGQEAVEVAIYREAGANLVEVAEAVRERLWGPGGTPEGSAKAQAAAAAASTAAAVKSPDASGKTAPIRKPDWIATRLPSDVRLTLMSDQSGFVRDAIHEVNSSALLGGALAVAICFFFLGTFGTTFVIGLSVPVSIIATFGAMYAAGVSLNIMSLGGLALGIGMLVDSAIVVLESIEKCREEGDAPFQAALRGVREVGGAVAASALTTIAVFAPIVFVEGVAGQTFGDQALTVVASLTISLLVALFFVPGLAARLGSGQVKGGSILAGARASVRTRWDALLPHFRGRLPLFRKAGYGLRWRRFLIFGFFALLLAVIGGWMFAVHGPGLDDAWNPPKVRGAPPAVTTGIPHDPVPEAVLERMAWENWLGQCLLLPALVLLLQPVVVVITRVVSDLLGAALFLMLGLVGAAGLLLRLLLFPFTWVFQRSVRFLAESAYPSVLRGSLRFPVLVFGITALLAVAAWKSAGGMGRELLPEVMQGELTAELYFPAGMPLAETDQNATRLEKILRTVPGVSETAVSSGTDRETISTNETGPHTAQILVRLDTTASADPRELERAAELQIRRLLEGDVALARFELRRPTLLALSAPLEIEIIGENLTDIQAAARAVQQELEGLEGIVDLRSSLRRGNPEVRITLDRDQLALHGLTVAEVSSRLRLAVEGEVSSTFPGRDERVDIRVRADLSRLARVDQLRDLPVNPGADRPLPLGAVAQFEVRDGPSDIRHIGGRRAATLSASLAGFDLGATAAAVEQRLLQVELPPGITATLAGQTTEMRSSLSSLGFALILAICLVYAVMAAQFESLLQPLLIMFTVPLAGIGVAFSLAWSGTPVSVIVLLGAVILAGIVVNNAIVLVDRINQNRSRGMEIDAAILEGGRSRLRPILMTTVTTVLGMLPLTGWFGASQGMELRAPMAVVVIAGLVSSTLLTLVVIPVCYRLLARSGLDQKKQGPAAETALG